MKINIVSDIVCPWCLIGYKRLEKAVDELGVKDQIELNWIPFELNPNMPAKGQNLDEHLTEKYGSTPEHLKATQDNLTTLASELGFTFDFHSDMKIVNTRDAHILLDYAKAFNKQTELNLRFITAVFSERKDISNRETILDELASIGLDRAEAEKKLNNEEARYAVVQEEKHWQQMGVTSTPTFVFEDMSAIPGAQPVEVFKNAISNLLQEA